MRGLFCDCKTDEEKSTFFLSGRAVETGVIAPAISNDVAMAYHRCAQFKKENDELRAMIQVALVVLDEVCGNINPERGYADELETDVKRAIAAISLYNAKGE